MVPSSSGCIRAPMTFCSDSFKVCPRKTSTYLSVSLSFLTFSFSVSILFAFLFLKILLTYPLAQRFFPRLGPVYQQAHQWHSSFFVTVFLILIISFWFFFRTSWKISLLTLLSMLACCLLYPLEPSLLYLLIIVV